MANERTFLAWVRTNIGIMAFGFVIEKFGLFIKQMGLILGKVRIQNPSSSHEYSALIGILIVGFGILMNIFAYTNFKRIEKQIEQHTTTYRPSEGTYSFNHNNYCSRDVSSYLFNSKWFLNTRIFFIKFFSIDPHSSSYLNLSSSIISNVN